MIIRNRRNQGALSFSSSLTVSDLQVAGMNFHQRRLTFDLDKKRRIRARHPNLRTELRKFAV